MTCFFLKCVKIWGMTTGGSFSPFWIVEWCRMLWTSANWMRNWITNYSHSMASHSMASHSMKRIVWGWIQYHAILWRLPSQSLHLSRLSARTQRRWNFWWVEVQGECQILSDHGPKVTLDVYKTFMILRPEVGESIGFHRHGDRSFWNWRVWYEGFHKWGHPQIIHFDGFSPVFLS